MLRPANGFSSRKAPGGIALQAAGRCQDTGRGFRTGIDLKNFIGLLRSQARILVQQMDGVRQGCFQICTGFLRAC